MTENPPGSVYSLTKYVNMEWMEVAVCTVSAMLHTDIEHIVVVEYA